MVIWQGLLAVIGLSVLRYAIIQLYKKSITGIQSDGITHYHIFRQIKQKKDHREWSNFIYDAKPSYYPDLFHHITAKLFTIAQVEKRVWLPSFLYFCMGVSIFVGAVYYVTGISTIQSKGLVVMAAAGLFAVAINNLDFTKNRRHYIDFSERLLAKFCVGFYVLFLYLAITMDTRFALIPVGLCAVVMLMSQFGRQAICLFSLIAAVLLWSLIPVLVWAVGVILAFVVAPKAMYYGMKGWLAYMKTYRRIMQNSVATQEKLSKLYTWSHFKKELQKSSVHAGYYILSQEPLVSMITGLSAVLLLYFHYAIPGVELSSTLRAFLIAPFIASLITALKPFRFIGQSYRYVDYLLYLLPIPYLAMIAVQRWHLVSIYLVGYVVLSMSYAGLKWAMFEKKKDRNDPLSSLKEAVSAMGINSENVVLMLFGGTSRDIVYLTNCKVLYYQTYVYYESALALFEENRFPFIKTAFKPLMQEYNVDTIVVDKQRLDASGLSYDFSGLSKVYENNRYALYHT